MVVIAHNVYFFTPLLLLVQPQALTSREGPPEHTVIARQGHRGDALSDGPRRSQPRSRPPDEQVVGTFPLIPTLTPLSSPPLTSSSSRTATSFTFSQSVANGSSVPLEEGPSTQPLVHPDVREGCVTLGGDQAQSDGRVPQLACPLCGATFKDVFSALPHITECRVPLH